MKALRIKLPNAQGERTNKINAFRCRNDSENGNKLGGLTTSVTKKAVKKETLHFRENKKLQYRKRY